MNLVVLSGGLDSTALAARVRADGPGVRAVSFSYRQRHRRELSAAAAVAEHLGIPHTVLALDGIITDPGSALTAPTSVPHGHYSDTSMAATVVHARNLMFAAAACAVVEPGDSVWFGVHAGDHPVYADCRPAFWQPLDEIVRAAYGVEIFTPYLRLSKADIVVDAQRTGAPLHLTWSCYEGGVRHCGRCGTCVERAEAFDLAGVLDPTDYVDVDFWRTVART